jgi:L-asparagine transporter-like permease
MNFGLELLGPVVLVLQFFGRFAEVAVLMAAILFWMIGARSWLFACVLLTTVPSLIIQTLFAFGMTEMTPAFVAMLSIFTLIKWIVLIVAVILFARQGGNRAKPHTG